MCLKNHQTISDWRKAGWGGADTGIGDIIILAYYIKHYTYSYTKQRAYGDTFNVFVQCFLFIYNDLVQDSSPHLLILTTILKVIMLNQGPLFFTLDVYILTATSVQPVSLVESACRIVKFYIFEWPF